MFSKAPFLAIAGMMFYAAANVVLEYRLAKYNNLTVVIGYAGITCILALIIRQSLRHSDPGAFAFPAGTDLLWLGLLGLLFFAADFFYVGAYTDQGKLATITCISALFPVFASLVKLAGSRVLTDMHFDMPTPLTIAGYVLGFAAVTCIVLGSRPAAA